MFKTHTAETHDTLQVQRGKVLEVFSLLGKAQATLFELQARYAEDKELVSKAENGVQAIHLVVEYLTPSLPTLVKEYKEKMKHDRVPE